MMKAHMGVAGRYRIKTFKADADGNSIGLPTQDTGWFKNLVLDQGLVRLASRGGAQIDRCRVGSGNNTPAASDTALQSQVASTTTAGSLTQGAASTAPYYGFTRSVFTFAVGAAAGNLSEVGVGWAETGNTLFSRALITDQSGNPTTLVVQADEILQVTYEIRFYPVTTDVVSTITLIGVDYTATLRPANITDSQYWSGWGYMPGAQAGNTSGAYPGASTIGAITSNPSGTRTAFPGSPTYDTSQSSSFKVRMTYAVSLTDLNLAGGIGAVRLGSFSSSGQSGGAWQVGFSPALPKTVARTASFTLELTFGRYTP